MSAARFCLVAGCLFGGLAVAAGAFGTHALEATFAETRQAEIWATACRYGMYHALALLASGLITTIRPTASGLPWAVGWCFVAGTLIFSGCLAGLAVSGARVLGAVVPIGGALLLLGWASLTALAIRCSASRSCEPDKNAGSEATQ
jgi:uncharacterized membrane protein YgdD (TMEM256/DUF423 family)